MKKKIELLLIGLMMVLFVIFVEAITIPGDTSYSYNESYNLTHETGFSHLNISNESIVFYMPFDENVSATTTYDYTNYSNDGTLDGAVWNSAGYIGGRYDFNRASKNKINLANTDGFLKTINEGGIYTVSVWVRSTTNGQFQGIFSGFNNGLSRGYGIAKYNNDSYVCHEYTTIDNIAAFSPAYVDTDWHNIVCTMDTTMTMRIYVDNVLYGSKTSIGGGRNFPTAPIIGRFFVDIDDHYWDGSIDELIAYNKTLSTTEISNLYNNQSIRFYSQGNMSFWHNDLGTNDTANITISQCNMYLNSNLSARINNGSIAYFSKTGTNCSITDYLLNNSGDITNANLTIFFTNGSGRFYSPSVIGNITIDGYIGFLPPPPSPFPFSVYNYGVEYALVNWSIINESTLLTSICALNGTIIITSGGDDCNSTGACAEGNVAYMNFNNSGNFNITNGNLYLEKENTNAICFSNESNKITCNSSLMKFVPDDRFCVSILGTGRCENANAEFTFEGLTSGTGIAIRSTATQEGLCQESYLSFENYTTNYWEVAVESPTCTDGQATDFFIRQSHLPNGTAIPAYDPFRIRAIDGSICFGDCPYGFIAEQKINFIGNVSVGNITTSQNFYYAGYLSPTVPSGICFADTDGTNLLQCSDAGFTWDEGIAAFIASNVYDTSLTSNGVVYASPAATGELTTDAANFYYDDGTTTLTTSTGYATSSGAGITDSTSYWLCTAADCSTTCQVSISGGIIIGCT